ncbi:amino acid ABC transporter permease [Bacillus megaterium]|nr:amino acid ABC transporter permease [Priestia megaterium]
MGKAFDIELIFTSIPQLLSYLHITIWILIASLVIGSTLGLFIALPRIYKVPVLSQIAAVYISFMRGTPILIQLFLVFYGIPALLQLIHIDVSRMAPLVFVIITYSLSTAASFSEMMRGAINSVDKGQTEAAYSIGMTGKQTFTRIVLPQALVVAFPNFGNLVIGSLKDTSLAFTIGVMDMMGRGDTIIAATAHAVEVYIALAIIYYFVAIILEKFFVESEQKLQKHYQPVHVYNALTKCGVNMIIYVPFIFTAFVEILMALPLTLLITIFPLLVGLLIGIAVAAVRINSVKIITPIANVYVSFFRGTPAILHIMVIYLGFPLFINKLSSYYGWGFNANSIPIVVFVLIALSFTAGAYMSEIIRSGLLAVEKGQIEAAYAIGMNRFQSMKRIVFPQAFALSLPNLCNIFIGFLHTSSIAFIVSQKELNGAANIVASNNLKFLEAYIAAALIYWMLTMLIEGITALLERKLTVYNRGGVV